MEIHDSSLPDLAVLSFEASEFASYPGVQNDASAKAFLERYPLPVMFGALQSGVDVPGLESSLVSCLERIFKTKYGASLILQYMSFVQVGLQANSQMVRCLACKAVSNVLGNVEDETETAVQLLVDYDLYPLLVNSLIDGNEQVAMASMNAIHDLAKSPKGIGIIFPVNSNDATHLKCIAARSSSLARIRVLALIAKLFSISSLVAAAVYRSDLLILMEEEVNNSDDMLMSLSALEILYEMAASPHGTEYLLRTTLLQILTSMISNTSLDPILRSRAIQTIGRLLSSDDIFAVSDESSIKTALLAIDGRLDCLKDEDTDEFESALDALGQIGSSIQGAELLFSSPTPIARHVVAAAFTHQGRGRQLAALHALGNVCGENRSNDTILLNDYAEEWLRNLIYTAAANSSKLTPSGLFLSILQQESEIRLASYRLIAGLVARLWCLLEVCSKQEIIEIVTNPHIEKTKQGMEARHMCCVAISKALSTSNKLNDPALAETAAKLQDAVRRGPYLAKERTEAQPVVITAERF